MLQRPPLSIRWSGVLLAKCKGAVPVGQSDHSKQLAFCRVWGSTEFRDGWALAIDTGTRLQNPDRWGLVQVAIE